MRWTKYVALSLVSLLILTAMAAGQGKTTPAVLENPTIPLKVQVVIKEYKGANKLSSLPYTISVTASDRWGDFTHLRMELRVPIVTGTHGDFSYQDVGTNIDCKGKTLGRGLFDIGLAVERSFLYSAKTANSVAMSNEEGLSPAPTNPIISRFSTGLNLVMRDGETIESTMATDPVSGRVLKVDVTLQVVK
jgi:hypothetical protein